MQLTGEKVVLSLASEEDIDFFCKIQENEDLWYFEEYVETDRIILEENFFKKIKKEIKAYDFIIKRLRDGTDMPVGIAQIWSYIEHRKSWEIGYAILPEYQNRGYGSDSVKLLLEFAFKHLEAHKVVGMCNANNLHSAAIMENNGMDKEAVFKKEFFWNNKWVDQYYFSILENEFFHLYQ